MPTILQLALNNEIKKRESKASGFEKQIKKKQANNSNWLINRARMVNCFTSNAIYWSTVLNA